MDIWKGRHVVEKLVDLWAFLMADEMVDNLVAAMAKMKDMKMDLS